MAQRTKHLSCTAARLFHLPMTGRFCFQWTSDQDITDAVQSVGVGDFVEVKFFENRANGQSKGFCVISLGSEQSMRICMERLPKKELHGQNPIVTFPTKQALNQVCTTVRCTISSYIDIYACERYMYTHKIDQSQRVMKHASTVNDGVHYDTMQFIHDNVFYVFSV